MKESILKQITSVTFSQFLEKLHDRGTKENYLLNGTKNYELLRKRLLMFFARKKLFNSDELTDITIDLLIKKMMIDKEDIENISAYALKIARNLANKELNTQQYQLSHKMSDVVFLGVNESVEQTVLEKKCLEECFEKLSDQDQQTILNYFDNTKELIKQRANLAEQLNVSAETLRVRVYRIRQTLQDCINNCLKNTKQSN